MASSTEMPAMSALCVEKVTNTCKVWVSSGYKTKDMISIDTGNNIQYTIETKCVACDEGHLGVTGSISQGAQGQCYRKELDTIISMPGMNNAPCTG